MEIGQNRALTCGIVKIIIEIRVKIMYNDKQQVNIIRDMNAYDRAEAREETDEGLCPLGLFGSDKPVQDGDSV